VVKKFSIDPARYSEFEYLCFLDISDPLIENYVKFHLGKEKPIIYGRLAKNIEFWKQLRSPEWLISLLEFGVRVPWATAPPRFMLSNSKTVTENNVIPLVRDILLEYLELGFVKKVETPPHCVLPLQLKNTGGKMALIYDMSPVNEYVDKGAFKLESWEEMLEYSRSCEYAIKFDLKKYFHEISIYPDDQKFFGFMYKMNDNSEPEYFVWQTMPYGYNRTPFIANAVMKPLINKWRKLGAFVVVFYDDGMAVSADYEFMRKLSLQMHCDLLRAGLLPGIDKCIWDPVRVVDWNGLTFDFSRKALYVKESRVTDTLTTLCQLKEEWPTVTFRQVSRCVGKLTSMLPVLGGTVLMKTKMMQTVVNIRNFKNLSWDNNVQFDYKPLRTEVSNEIEFWILSLKSLNCRPFLEVVPGYVAWTDASDVAVGGVVVKVTPSVSVKNVLTMDNFLLREAVPLSLNRGCANMQTDELGPYQYGIVPVRDKADLDPELTESAVVVRRNLCEREKALSSTERELIAALHMLISCVSLLKGSGLTLHMDSQNAVSILSKGSNKPRLNAYATECLRLCLSNDVRLHCAWVPRDLNMLADQYSRDIDFDDHCITAEFFQKVAADLPCIPTVDCFADNFNTVASSFFSRDYCPGTLGVDALHYAWSRKDYHWIFPPMKLICRTANHLKLCRAAGAILTPQWTNFAFFPYLTRLQKEPGGRGTIRYGMANMFKQGSDSSSYFGPKFKGHVVVWMFDYRTCQ